MPIARAWIFQNPKLPKFGYNLVHHSQTQLPDPPSYQHPSFRVNFSLLWWMVLFSRLARFTAPHRNCVHKVFDEFSRYVSLQPAAVEFLHQKLRREGLGRAGVWCKLIKETQLNWGKSQMIRKECQLKIHFLFFKSSIFMNLCPIIPEIIWKPAKILLFILHYYCSLYHLGM